MKEFDYRPKRLRRRIREPTLQPRVVRCLNCPWQCCNSLNVSLEPPEKIGDAILFVERREVEFEVSERSPCSGSATSSGTPSPLFPWHDAQCSA